MQWLIALVLGKKSQARGHFRIVQASNNWWRLLLLIFFYKTFITWLMNKNKYWNNAPTRVQFYIFNCLLFTRFCLYLPNQPAFGWLINPSLHLKVLNIHIRPFIMGVLYKKINNWINTMCFFCKIKFDNVEYLV